MKDCFSPGFGTPVNTCPSVCTWDDYPSACLTHESRNVAPAAGRCFCGSDAVAPGSGQGSGQFLPHSPQALVSSGNDHAGNSLCPHPIFKAFE